MLESKRNYETWTWCFCGFFPKTFDYKMIKNAKKSPNLNAGMIKTKLISI